MRGRASLLRRLRKLEDQKGAKLKAVRVTITRHIVEPDLEAVQIVRRTFELYPEAPHGRRSNAGQLMGKTTPPGRP